VSDKTLVRARKNAEELEQRLETAQQRLGELQRELDECSLRDQLTGLPSPNVFFRHLETEVARAGRHGLPLSLAVIDVDAFRAINSRHGRAIGDQVLQAVDKLLPSVTRSVDFVTRTSADEFMVALPEVDAPAAAESFERLLLELEALRVGPLDCLSASVGVSEYARPMTADQLIASASDHLRRARMNGGGRTETRSGEADGIVVGETIAGLAEALLERDRYTGEHSEVVAELTAQVARSLGLGEREVERTRAAALLHDIGKVGIPDDILRKSRDLSDGEWLTMREHPVIGERIVRTIPGLGPVARVIRHEHENFDGSGYPDGLSGNDIPIGARIILACDAYHAMTSDRPYRAALPHAAAIRELAEGSGSQFDPQVTEVLIGYLFSTRLLSPDGAAA
jgi:diguanylate cyclase (GGDEF)-like protein/putative nucleotidyltransferase with HDIG domain